MSIVPSLQRLPKLLAILALANRRATLEFSGAVGNVFRGEMKIVRTSLNRKGQAELLCRFAGPAAHRQTNDEPHERGSRSRGSDESSG